MVRGAGRTVFYNIAHWVTVLFFTVALAFPFYWMVIATFKQSSDLYNIEANPFKFNAAPTWANLHLLLFETSFLHWLINTAIVGVLVVGITLVLALPAAYALARLTGRWGQRLGIGIFLTYLVPPTLLFIPLSRVVAILGLQDTIWSVVVVYPSFTIPFSIWLLMGFFKSIPKELEDAAMVDGLTRFQAFYKLVIPISLSGILTVVIFTFTLVLALPAAYALARLTGRWGQRLGIGIFLTYLVPPTLLFIPLSRVVAILGLQDTIWSVVVVYPSFTIPFSIWLLMGFFKSIPKDLEDAAMVDGLSRFQAFYKLVIPISLSGILTVVIFTFTLVTQEFVYALTFISPEAHQMLSVGVPTFLIRGDVYFWGSLMAGCLIASVPIALVYNLFLDRFIAGFTVGAVK